jgi:hypothetical protein
MLTVKEVAKRFGTTIQTIYATMTDIEVRKKVVPKRQGRRIIIDDDYYLILKSELERKGHYERREK